MYVIAHFFTVYRFMYYRRSRRFIDPKRFEDRELDSGTGKAQIILETAPRRSEA